MNGGRVKRRVVGLIVNPVAGMGGSVGLKGTDGEMYERALELGAQPVTPTRTADVLDHIEHKDDLVFLAAPGKMGENYLREMGLDAQVVGSIGASTSAEDTKRIARHMAEGRSQGFTCADLLIFVGGDGTARDICDAVDAAMPVVGVPSGVKVFSSAFALSARAAAEMVDAFVAGADVTEAEVLDIDEEAFRQDRLASKAYGYLLVPEVRQYLQPGKTGSDVTRSSSVCKEEIAVDVVEGMDPEALYLLGPGTTLRAITEEMGVPKTLLGVDAVARGAVVGEDVNERDILALFERYDRRKIIVTPIGGNGFIFGRGSKQFTPQVIRQVGRENVVVVATRHKLSDLACLRVDTGDEALDETLSGPIKVTVGDGEWMMADVRC